MIRAFFGKLLQALPANGNAGVGVDVVHSDMCSSVVRDGSDVRSASAVVTALEINPAHGTGVLIRRVFKHDQDFVHVRCMDFYDGNSAGALRLRIPAGVTAEQALTSTLGDSSISRILVVPWHQQDVANALALRSICGAKMCVWVMDHNRGDTPGNVSARNMEKLVSEADLLLAISPELADHYGAEFGKKFHFAPPIVDEALCCREAIPVQDSSRLGNRQGVLVGNIWSASWLKNLLFVLQRTSLQLEAFGVAASSHAEGGSLENFVAVRGYVPEENLIRALRGAAYALVPGGMLDDHDDLTSVSRFSLPSRLVYLSAVGNLPIIYLGSTETAAARFISRHDLGVVCPYDPEIVGRAVDWICQPEQQRRFRGAAARSASVFGADDMADWIWRSTELGAPVDQRWAVDATAARRPSL